MDIHETNRAARYYEEQADAKREQANGYKRIGMLSLAAWFYCEAADDYKAAAQVYRDNGWQDGLESLDKAATDCRVLADTNKEND